MVAPHPRACAGSERSLTSRIMKWRGLDTRPDTADHHRHGLQGDRLRAGPLQLLLLARKTLGKVVGTLLTAIPTR